VAILRRRRQRSRCPAERSCGCAGPDRACQPGDIPGAGLPGFRYHHDSQVRVGRRLGAAATGTDALSRVPLAVLTLTALAAFEAVTALPAAVIQLDQARVSAGRITAVTDAADPVRAPGRPRAVPPGPFGIQLLDATVRYRQDGPPAMDRVSLDLPPGRRVALVGANGAGKSTLAAVLLRFRDLTGGAALLNGRDLASFAPDDVRSVIGGCPQDPHVFNATIRRPPSRCGWCR
jgi:ABC-type multidrug transport system fused ATPase/permease subunit